MASVSKNVGIAEIFVILEKIQPHRSEHWSVENSEWK